MLQTLLARLRADSGLSQLLKQSGVLYIAGLFSLGLTFAQQISTARILGAEDYGRLAVVISSGLLVMMVVDFRTWEVATKYMARPIADGDSAESVRVVSWLVSVEVVTGVLGAVVTALLAAPVARYLLQTPELDTLVRVYAISVPFRVMSSGVIGVLPRLYDHFAWVAAKSVIYAVIRLVLMTGAALLGFGLMGVVVAAVVGEVLNIGILGLMALALHRKYLQDAPLFDLTPSPSRKQAITLMRHVWLSSTLAGLHYQTFVPLLALLTTPVQVGLFRSGLDIAELVEKTIQPLALVFSPRIIGLYEQGQVSEFRRYLKQVAVLMFSIVLPLTIGLCIVVPLVLPILLPTYEGIVPVTVILVIGIGIHTALQWWIRPALIALNLVNWLNVITFILIVLSVMGLVLLVPSLNSIGGALVKAGFMAFVALLSLLILTLRLASERARLAHPVEQG